MTMDVQKRLAWLMLLVAVFSGWCVAGESCNERVVLNNTWGVITDGPGKYKEEAHCEWLIQALVPGQVINLEFLEMTTECSYDQVLVYDGLSYEDRLLGAFSGDTLPHRLYALSGHMLICFYSDYNYIMEGFTAVYSVTGCPFNCSGTNGNCDLPSHTCVCNIGYTGESCQTDLCPGNCHGHGTCDSSSQRCLCDQGYAGHGCTLPVRQTEDTSSVHYAGQWFDVMPSDSGFTARASHAGVFVTEENSLYLFGGTTLYSVLDELIKYDFNQNRWVEVQKQLPWPEARHSHAMCEYGGRIYLYGGVLEDGRHSDGLWVYDIAANLWSDKTVDSGSVMRPAAVASHTLTVVGDDAYLFGGRTMDGRFLSDMFRLHLNASSPARGLPLDWTEVVPRGGRRELRRLAGHSAVYHPESLSILVFGGFTPESARFPARTNSIHAFHVEANYWTELHYDNHKLSSSCDGEEVAVEPLQPQLRAFQAAAILGNYLVVYGGNSHIHRHLEVCYDDGLYFYHLGCHAWVNRAELEQPFGTFKEPDEQRGRFSMVAVPAFGNTLLISGGYRGNVLGDLVAYRVPVSVARHQDHPGFGNQSTHCHLHTHCDHCKYDSECIWCMKMAEQDGPGCVSRSQKQLCSHEDVIKEGFCQPICSTLTDCGSCTVQGQGVTLTPHSPPHYWYNPQCTWCVKEAQCLQTGESHEVANTCDRPNATKSGLVGWWGGRSQSLMDISQCRLLDNPAGLHYLAFNYPQDYDHPDQVKLIRRSGTDFHMTHKKRDGEDQSQQFKAKLRGYIYPLEARRHLQGRLNVILVASYANVQLFVSRDETEADKELVARLHFQTMFYVKPANRSGNNPIFANESRGFKYYTEVEMSKPFNANQKSTVRVEWTGALTEVNYKQELSSEFLEPYNTNNCSYYDTCLACMMDTSCGWCEQDSTCFLRADTDRVCHRDLPTYAEIELVTNPEECPTCDHRIGCQECLQDERCEWIVSDIQCTRRGRVSDALRKVSECAAPCHQRASCSSCISISDECVWCETTQTCLPFLEYIARYAYGGCIDWVDLSGNKTCHDCSKHANASSCLTEFRCGWCGNIVNPTLGKCIDGDFSGPSTRVNCTHFLQTQHMVSGPAAWSYGMLPAIDKCDLGLDECHTNATCINSYTDYECVCKQGFIGNGRDVCDRTCFHACIQGTCSQAPHYECLCETGWTGPDCNTNCGCHNHSSCSEGKGQCDKCQHLTQGQHCELCKAGAYGDATMVTGCQKCQCNGHADHTQGFCDAVTGQCFCKDNTWGDQCQFCEEGYYGNPSDGAKCYLRCDARTVLTNVTEGSLGSHQGRGVNELTDQVYCVWILTVYPTLDREGQSDLRPTISFTMETSLRVACSQDSVYVYDGIPPVVEGLKTSHSSLLLASFCGNGLPHEVSVVARSGYLTVLFEGYRALAGGRTSGFNASYYVNRCPDYCHGNRSCDPGSGKCVCGHEVTEEGETLQFGGPDCRLALCPHDCSQRGSCVDGKLCRCEQGFGGDGCEQKLESIAVTLQTDRQRTEGLGVYTDSLPRMGHSVATCGQSDIYMFGGYSLGLGVLNDLWYLNVTSTKWEKKEPAHKEAPSARYFHSLFCDSHTRQLYLYGGLSTSLHALSDIWMFDILTSNWTQLQPTLTGGMVSIPRLAAHTMTYTGQGSAFVIGGFSIEDYFNSQTYVLDITTLEWSVLTTSGYPPIGVYGHSAVYHADSSAIYVFGGYKFHLDTVSPSSRLYSLDLNRKRWSELPAVPGNKPGPRFFHTAVSTPNYMLVYGGQTSRDHITSEVMVYTYRCNRWSALVYDTVIKNHTVTVQDLSLTQPYSVFTGVDVMPLTASAAVYVDNAVYIFGGLHSLTYGQLYKVEIPADICSIYKDLVSCQNSVGCSACFLHHTNTTVCYSQEGGRPQSCTSTVGSVTNFTSDPCDRGLVERRHCQDYSTCSECLAQWSVHSGHSTVCKWCTQCKTGKCIPVNTFCEKENVCSKPQVSVNTSDSCVSLKCQVADCERCYKLGDCVWTYQHKRDGEIGYLVNEEPKFNHTCIPRDDLKTSPIAISHSNTCPRSCTDFTDCTTCLTSKGSDGGAIECVWNLLHKQCLPLHSLPLYCITGQCGHVLQGPKSLCPASCDLYTRCDDCLTQPHCGWCTTEHANGKGSCVEGGLNGPINSQCDTREAGGRDWFTFEGQSVWSYIQCPLENECTNGHHDCDVNEECIDLEERFTCQCKEGYNRTQGSPGGCQPVCSQGCDKGDCVEPDRCQCHFGHVGDNCSLECLCNGHSNCLGVTMELRKSCVQCYNNTMGDQCNLCKLLYVGNPIDGGSCESCVNFCNQHSDVCMSVEDYNKSQSSSPRLPVDKDRALSWLRHGPVDRSSTVCVNCQHSARGANCSQCEPGYFRLQTNPTTEPCKRCQCHGHSSSCQNSTGICNECHNNTQSSCTNNPETDRECWELQCSSCTDKYNGTPTNGHQCYLEMSVMTAYCYQSNTGNKCCYDHSVAECTTKPTVLKRGKTIFYAIQPQYINVDIRIVLDVTEGGLDMYLSPFQDTWIVYNDPTTWEHVVTIDPKYLKHLSHTDSSEQRAKRASLLLGNVYLSSRHAGESSSGDGVWSLPKPDLLEEEERGRVKGGRVRREATPVHNTTTTHSSDKDTNHYDNQTVKLVDTTAKGMFSFQSLDYKQTLLIVRDVRNRLVIRLPHTQHKFDVSKFYMVLHGRGSANSRKNDTFGSVFFRQDQPHIDLFVFFAVFFAAFFMKLAIIVLIWKVKQSYDAQRSRQQRQKEMRHMASRPFAKCMVIIEPPNEFNREVVVTPDSNNPPPPQQPPLPLQLPSHHHKVATTGARSKHASGGGHMTLTNTSSAFRAARNKIGNLGSSRSSSLSDPHTITNVHPIGLESVDDGIAAVGTVVFQMPGGIQAPVGLAFGSALVTTRVSFPSLNHRSTSIPRQGSTSV